MVDTLAIALSFQPALPMRGVTDVNGTGAKPVYVFQPALPMRGVTTHQRMICLRHLFQPALPMRGVTPPIVLASRSFLFQPALPMRGVTRPSSRTRIVPQISTRTPHAGSDPQGPLLRELPAHFNPHSPCGE